MLNQDFAPKQLIKLCKKNELIDNKLSKEDVEKDIEETWGEILSNTFSFDLKPVNNFYVANNFIHKLVLRKLNDNLKRLYKVKQGNRRIIISQIITLLEETCPIWILKTDISSFYNNIKRYDLLDKFKEDTLPSYYSVSLLKQLFINPLISDINGLPRGMNTSATLSEIYMRKFDRWIRSCKGVYYYARFVDDIIVFANYKETIDIINEQIDKKLSILAKGLQKNTSKTEIFNGNDIAKKKPMEYLGYKFYTENIRKKKSKKTVKKLWITIADKKNKKIKTRIIYAFLDYRNNKNFSLLLQRIKFLTGNYSVKHNTENNDLKAGIYYNYSNINKYDVLNELNLFYQKALFSKNKSFGIKLTGLLSNAQKDKLRKYSFRHGFLKRVYHPFSYENMKQIKACWK